MPSSTAALGPLYLGLEVALDRIRAILLDGELGVVQCVEVELDSLPASKPCVSIACRDVPLRTTPRDSPPSTARALCNLCAIRTTGGLWRSPGGSANQPLNLVLAGLDHVIERLSMTCDLDRVASIGGCAHVRTLTGVA